MDLRDVLAEVYVWVEFWQCSAPHRSGLEFLIRFEKDHEKNGTDAVLCSQSN